MTRLRYLLSLAAMMLMARLVWQAVDPYTPPAVPISSVTAPAIADPEPSELAAFPSEAFAEISARPLFSPSRRPAIAPIPAAVIAAPLPTNLMLVGIISNPEGRMAVLRALGTPTAIIVAAGQTVAGLTVVEVQASSVLRRAGASEIHLNLQKH